MYRNRCCGSGGTIARLSVAIRAYFRQCSDCSVSRTQGRGFAPNPVYTVLQGLSSGCETQLAFWGNPQNTIELSEGELRPLRSALCCCAAPNGKEKMTGFAALPFFFPLQFPRRSQTSALEIFRIVPYVTPYSRASCDLLQS